MHAVIQQVVDDGDMFEIHGEYAKNIIVGKSLDLGCWACR